MNAILEQNEERHIVVWAALCRLPPLGVRFRVLIRLITDEDGSTASSAARPSDRSLKSNDSATRRRVLLVARAQQMMLARTLKRKRTSAAGRLLRRLP